MLRLSLALLLMGGCFSEPGRPSGVRDGGGDDGDGGSGSDADAPLGQFPTAKVLATAYYSSSTNHSTGMSATNWELDADLSMIHNGQLLVIFGNVDNGSTTVYSAPLAPGFQYERRDHYNEPDAQSVVFAARFANNETSGMFKGTYGSGIGSAAAAMALIAVDGVDPSTDLATLPLLFGHSATGVPGTKPVVDTVQLTTNKPNSLVLYGMGLDWSPTNGGDATFTPPSGTTPLVELTDHGGASVSYDWSTLMVVSKTVAAAETVVSLTASMDSTEPALQGGPWHAMVAIPAAP